MKKVKYLHLVQFEFTDDKEMYRLPHCTVHICVEEYHLRASVH